MVKLIINFPGHIQTSCVSWKDCDQFGAYLYIDQKTLNVAIWQWEKHFSILTESVKLRIVFSISSHTKIKFWDTIPSCQHLPSPGVDSPGDELVGRLLGPVLGVHHEQHVGKPGAEVGAVDVVMAGRLGGVHVHTLRTVELHHGLARHVGKTWMEGTG